MKLNIVKGKTSKSVDVLIRDTSSTSGAGLTGLVFNTSGLTAYYHRPGSAPTAITLATLSGNTAAFSSGGFIAVDGTNMPGLYRLDVPDAALASGVDEVIVMLKGAANMEPVSLEIQLTSVDPNDAVRMGLTALPNAASGAAGAIITSGTGTAQISTASGQVLIQAGTGAGQLSFSSGVIAANVTQYGGSAGTFSGGRPEVNTTFFGGTLGTFATGIPSVNTVQVRGVQPNNLISGRFDASVGAVAAGAITNAAFAADAIDANALAATATAEIAAAIKALVIETNGSVTLGQFCSVALAVLAGITSGGGNTFKDPSGTTTRVAATTDVSNNRTGMTLTPSS